MGVVVNRDPTAHTFSIISSSAYPAAYWGTITPPPPHVTGGTVRFATHDLAVGVKSQLNALEYQRVAALRSLNTNFAPHKFWMPLNTYSIQDNGPQGSGNGLMSQAEEDAKASTYVAQEMVVAMPPGADRFLIYSQLQQVATALEVIGTGPALVAALTAVTPNASLSTAMGIPFFADLASIAIFATSFGIGALVGTMIYVSADQIIQSDYTPIYLLDQPVPSGMSVDTVFGGGASSSFSQLEEFVE